MNERQSSSDREKRRKMEADCDSSGKWKKELEKKREAEKRR